VQILGIMGDSMKRAGVVLGSMSLAVLNFAVWAGAQTGAQPAQQTSPAAGQTAPAQGAQPATPAGPAAKRPPQAKTQPEFDAYKAAATLTDPAAAEKASDDFATKFPDSEIRILLYTNAMRLYQGANNPEKTEAMGRKMLALDPDNPEALVTVAEVVAERTRDSDIDKDQHYAEAVGMAQKATTTVDTDIQVPAGTPQDRIDAYKALLRSRAYSIIGTIEFKKENYSAAAENLQKSIDVYPSDPDKVVVLRLALTLDKEQKYPEALKVANRAVELTTGQGQETGIVGSAARKERDRLQQLTGAAAPVAPATQPTTPPKN
jgi:tetratricopeptide (TPR) repeat protein